MKIFVGNMSFEVTEEDLLQAFGASGQVASAAIIKDKARANPKDLDSWR